MNVPLSKKVWVNTRDLIETNLCNFKDATKIQILNKRENPNNTTLHARIHLGNDNYQFVVPDNLQKFDTLHVGSIEWCSYEAMKNQIELSGYKEFIIE